MKTLASGLLTLTLATACSAATQNAVPPLAPSSAMAPTATAGALVPHGTRAANIYFSGRDAETPQPVGELGVFKATANGNVAPVRVIRGPETDFYSPENAVYDPSTGRIWTCDFTHNKILSFQPGAANNIAPDIIIAGSNVPLYGCGDVALGPNGKIYASSYDTGPGYTPSVYVWPAGSNGNVLPTEWYYGSNTGFGYTSGLAFDANGYLYVSNTSPNSIDVFSQSFGNVPPYRKIAGSNSKLGNPFAIAIDPSTQHLWAANETTSQVEVFGPSANGNRSPLYVIAGPNTHIDNPYGIAVDHAGYVYVGNCPQGKQAKVGSILVFAPGAHGNVSPVQTIEGSNADISCVGQLSVY